MHAWTKTTYRYTMEVIMGAVFENLTLEELCDLMCGDPEEEEELTDGKRK